jgi:MSHA pilin protein MshC
MFGKSPASHRGFTLVEMIVVIVLIGILSVSIIGRFLGNNAFDGAIVRDQLVALVRASQQKALGRREVSLTLEAIGNELHVVQQAIDPDGSPLVLENRTIPARGVNISHALDTASCASGGLTALTAPLELRFEAPGNLVSVNGAPFTNAGMRICIDENPALSLCVSATGYAFTGNCDV